MSIRHGSIVVSTTPDDNLTIDTAHRGGFVRDGRVVIERADRYDLFRALRDSLGEFMCLACGGPKPVGRSCQCENDE